MGLFANVSLILPTVTSDGSGEVVILEMIGNQLTEIPANTIPINRNSSQIFFGSNDITTIDPGAFTFLSVPGERNFLKEQRCLKLITKLYWLLLVNRDKENWTECI